MGANHRRKLGTEEKAKVVALWGTHLNAKLVVLAARMIWTKVDGRTSILEGWWFGSSIFRASIPQSIAVILFILLFKSSWCKIASAARNWINLSPRQQGRPLPSLLSLSFFYMVPTLSSPGQRSWTRAAWRLYRAHVYCTAYCTLVWRSLFWGYCERNIQRYIKTLQSSTILSTVI